MSFLFFGNVPASVPPVLDTTPCLNEMLNYEDCVFELIYFFIYIFFNKNPSFLLYFLKFIKNSMILKCESTSTGDLPPKLADSLA